MNVSLPDQMKSWVERQAEHGRYSNSSDYVRDLIRKDQSRQRTMSELQGLIDEGISSGEAEPFEIQAFVNSKLSKSKN